MSKPSLPAPDPYATAKILSPGFAISRIAASPKKIAEIEDIVRQIDVPATQIMLEARLIEVAVADDQQMGIDWAKLASLTMIITEAGAPQLLPDGSSSGVWYPGMDYNLKDDGTYEEIIQALTNGVLPEKMNFKIFQGTTKSHIRRFFYILVNDIKFSL